MLTILPKDAINDWKHLCRNQVLSFSCEDDVCNTPKDIISDLKYLCSNWVLWIHKWSLWKLCTSNVHCSSEVSIHRVTVCSTLLREAIKDGSWQLPYSQRIWSVILHTSISIVFYFFMWWSSCSILQCKKPRKQRSNLRQHYGSHSWVKQRKKVKIVCVVLPKDLISGLSHLCRKLVMRFDMW